MMLALVWMTATSFAQGIKGTVIDENGEPVIGATVADMSNTKNATITDFDGNFVINVKSGQTITISYIGYEAQTVAAKNGMTVRLQPDNKVLDEVVVVGYQEWHDGAPAARQQGARRSGGRRLWRAEEELRDGRYLTGEA